LLRSAGRFFAGIKPWPDLNLRVAYFSGQDLPLACFDPLVAYFESGSGLISSGVESDIGGAMPYLTKNQPRQERVSKLIADITVGALLLCFSVVFFGPARRP
jgi:hypothetical protein